MTKTRALFCLLLPAILSLAARACPSCKDALAAGDSAVAAGFARSIYLMLGGVGALLVLGAWQLWRIVKAETQVENEYPPN